MRLKTHKQSLLQILLLCITSVYYTLLGQSKDNFENQEIWTYFYPQIELNKKTEFIGDLGYRIQVENPEDFSTYFRPSWAYKPSKKLTLMGGLGIFHKNKIKNKVEKTEIRPWQGVEIKNSLLGIFKLQHLFRTEERFTFKDRSNLSEFKARLRYKLSGKFSSLSNSKWNIPFYGELFWPTRELFKNPYHNQFRSGVGISYSDKNWKLQMTYNWHLSSSNPLEDLSYQFNSTQIKLTRNWSRK